MIRLLPRPADFGINLALAIEALSLHLVVEHELVGAHVIQAFLVKNVLADLLERLVYSSVDLIVKVTRTKKILNQTRK